MKTYNKFLRINITIFLLFTGLILSSYSVFEDEDFLPDAPRVKNIILLIGDGMGIAHVSGAITISGNQLNMTTSRHIGFSKTQSYDNYITDSAASGTAMSSGTKTRNGMIGKRPDSTDVDLITEIIRKKKKMSYGVVSTSAITHATPASFVAHNISRNDYEGIALDFVRNQPDVFIGGGKNNFNARKDKRDLISVLERHNYDVVYDMDELKETQADKVAGLLANVHMPTISDGRGFMLAESTQKAIELLSRNKRGFFLVVEGSQIDWAGHENDAQYVIEETYDFDVAVGAALRFAYEDESTLVVVTADHETGGLTLTGGNLTDNSIKAAFSTQGHTGVAVPVFAFGPGAENFSGFYENTEIFEKFMDLLRIK